MSIKQISFIIIFLSIGFEFFSQITKNAEISKFSIGVCQSLDAGFRFTSSDDDSKWMKEISDSIEAPMFKNFTGLRIQFLANKKINFRTGITFTQRGYRYKNSILPEINDYREIYSFIEIPAQLTYKFSVKKYVPYLTTGVSCGYLIKANAKFRNEGKTDFENSSIMSESLNKFQINAQLGLGFSLKLSEKWLFIPEVLYSQSVQSLANGSVKKYLFTAGVNIGLYRFL